MNVSDDTLNEAPKLKYDTHRTGSSTYYIMRFGLVSRVALIRDLLNSQLQYAEELCEITHCVSTGYRV